MPTVHVYAFLYIFLYIHIYLFFCQEADVSIVYYTQSRTSIYLLTRGTCSSIHTVLCKFCIQIKSNNTEIQPFSSGLLVCLCIYMPPNLFATPGKSQIKHYFLVFYFYTHPYSQPPWVHGSYLCALIRSAHSSSL